MQPFIVIVPLHCSARQHVEIALHSFADFYFNMPKGQRKCLKLILIDRGDWLIEISNLVSALDIKDVSQIIFQEEIEIPEAHLKDMPVMFLPFPAEKTDWLDEALTKGIPVIGYQGMLENKLLDNSCSMLIARANVDESTQEFSRLLEMLYYDPGALKMLRRGAKRNQFTSAPKEGLVEAKVA